MSVDGNWTITMKTPLGSQAATLSFSTEGNALSGTFSSRLGSGDLANGRVDGNRLTWASAIKLPMPVQVQFEANVDGDSITGTADLGSRMGKAPFKGVRS